MKHPSQIKQQFDAFRLALQFMTCIPAGRFENLQEQSQSDSLFWFPAIGLVIGTALAIIAWISAPLPVLLQAAIIVAIWVVITGGLHLDGLADSADGWVGGLGSRERTLEIMADSRCGPFAVMAIAVTLMLKASALTSINTLLALALVPFIARLLIIPCFLYVQYARPKGLAGTIQNQLTDRKRTTAKGILTAGAILCWIVLSFKLWLGLALIATGLFIVWRIAVNRRLQGFTGDCVGALIEMSEVAMLLMLVVFGF